VPAESGCAACGENEHAAGGRCVCDEGFTRESPSASCEPFEEAPADECTGDDCVEPECESSLDCAPPMLCDVYGSETCVPPPEDDADCAGTEATYCEVFATLTCVVESCADDGRCPGDMVCCDYRILDRSLCIPQDALNGTECPAPGARVDRD
jgi:hypothetical protein